MKQPSQISPVLSAKLDALESSFQQLWDAAIAASQNNHGYTPEFRLLLKLEDSAPKFHRLINDLRNVRVKRAAA